MSDFVRIPPDSTGKKMTTRFNPTADSHTQGVHIMDRDNVNLIQRIDDNGAAYTRFADGSPQFDSFGRMVSSNTKAAYTVDFSCGCDPQGMSEFITDGGSWTVEPTGGLLLSTTTTSGSSVAIQTDEYFRYTAGFSTSFVFTMACGDAGKAGVVRRAGAFDAEDGVFFQIGEDGLSAVIRNSIDSSERVIPQSAFNGDPVDGSGLSGHVVDLTKDNIYWVDYQWLGAGAVSYGMFINGKKILLHREGHFNQLSHSYMKSGSRPFRFEQTNTTATGSGSEFRLFCVSVVVDANAAPVLFDRNLPITISETYNTSDDIHMLSIRPTQINSTGVTNRRKVGISEAMISGISATSGVFLVKLIKNATITGGVWESQNSAVEINKTATITGGVLVNQRLIKTDGDVMGLRRSQDAFTIKRKADPTQTETFSLVFQRLRGDDIAVDASFIISDGV